MYVQVEPHEASIGSPVRVTATPPPGTRQVSISVAGYVQSLTPTGDAWVLETTVPTWAPPGTYPVDVVAVDDSGRELARETLSFSVR